MKMTRIAVLACIFQISNAFLLTRTLQNRISQTEGSLSASAINPEVLPIDDIDDNDDDEDWTTDAQKEQFRQVQSRNYAEKKVSERPSAYTEEEEKLISIMGGKEKGTHREEGFLGDCTLREIATDYSIPVCYLADVLCTWGVPVPIDVYSTPLGDMVTGEQAFAILEAVNSLDVSALQDRYANDNLQQLCYEQDIPLAKAFEMAMKEGWSLPFGVHTNLRVEQVDELIRVLGKEDYADDSYDEL